MTGSDGASASNSNRLGTLDADAVPLLFDAACMPARQEMLLVTRTTTRLSFLLVQGRMEGQHTDVALCNLPGMHSGLQLVSMNKWKCD